MIQIAEDQSSLVVYISYGQLESQSKEIIDDVSSDEILILAPPVARELRFDVARFEANYKGAPKVAANLASSFIRDLPDLLENLDSAFGEWHCGAIQAVAYRIRHAVMPFCAKEITASALEIEQLAKRFELGLATEKYQILRMDLECLAEDLEPQTIISQPIPVDVVSHSA